ncbi:MAG: beta-propeller fold lactonase family protein [Acidobacteriaceae bacterium]|nr:beta-propeller fold lactonase family protein [Acidobacteriaceae bacterium]
METLAGRPSSFASKLIGTALTLTIATTFVSAADGDFKVVAHYRVSGSGKIQGIGIDSTARRIYVAQGARVDLLNADTGAAAGQIATGAGASDLILVPDIKRGFVANSGSNNIAVFDTDSCKVLRTVNSTGKAPSALTYDDGARLVFVANRDSGNITAFDPETGRIAGTVELGGKVGQLAATGYGRLFVVAPNTNLVHVVDTETFKSLGDFPTGTGEDCTGLALDPVGRRVFVGCANGRIPILDGDIGLAFEDLAGGGSGPSTAMFTFLPTGKGGWKGAAFITNADGTLTAVKMNAFVNYTIGAKSKLSSGIGPLALDTKTHHLLIAANGTRTPEVLVVSQPTSSETKSEEE